MPSTSPAIHKRRTRGPERERQNAGRKLTAAQSLGTPDEADHVTGLTNGQWCLIDAIQHMVTVAEHNVDVWVATWTTGFRAATDCAKLANDPRITDLRFLLDPSDFRRNPERAGPMIEILGYDRVHLVSMHAKLVVVRGKTAGAALRTTANLNKNLRPEVFDLSWTPDVVGFYADWFAAVWEASMHDGNTTALLNEIFDRYEAGEVTAHQQQQRAMQKDLRGKPALLTDFGPVKSVV